MQEQQVTGIGRIVDNIEETSIAICLGLMTMITFVNVVARYVFSDNILWAKEATEFLFAWLVLMGMSYGVKKHVHIGVDVVISHLSKPAKKFFALVSVAACLVFAVLLMIGAWKYWYPFATERAWMETEDLFMPDWMQFLSTWMNEGERYEKIPRWIPYLALPLGVGLLIIRLLQQAWRVVTGEIDMIIASHEAEELIEELEMVSPHPADVSMHKRGEG
ncbi:MAG: TRAP transporter small permease [Chromatiaceae bacterium]|nr:TRAP transporter small permease [Gammaproteobacteria bacterium]MCP5318910.1 TRAP transporter small permease [Chromatiaceae bacterium]MCW5586774.1 TRAP transporter small permease [Chromatiales bacterium]MCP5434001.1 TRAP transporter small permease [Chromatiaceae bacterium]HOP18305.1 TRAP transporter small permease [Gammaproteobacteria bacterium]